MPTKSEPDATDDFIVQRRSKIINQIGRLNWIRLYTSRSWCLCLIRLLYLISCCLSPEGSDPILTPTVGRPRPTVKQRSFTFKTSTLSTLSKPPNWSFPSSLSCLFPFSSFRSFVPSFPLPTPPQFLHLFQNLHPTSSLSLSPLLNPLPASFPLRLPTHPNQTTNPATINATTINVCTGCANTARLSKNNDTQQKMIGVVIHVRYGLSSSGSFTRRMIRPKTARK